MVTESYTYDSARRLTTLTRNTPTGTQVREWFYDAASNPVREEVRLNGTLIARSYTDYDELNRVRTRRGNDGQQTAYTYDLNGNLESITRTLGQVTQFQYDALNRLTAQTDAELGVTSFEYDRKNRITRVTDPRNLITTWQYDGFGRLWSYTNPDTGTTTQQWNAAGQHTSATRADGVTVSYGYNDPLGRPTAVTAGGLTQTTTWDAATTAVPAKRGVSANSKIPTRAWSWAMTPTVRSPCSGPTSAARPATCTASSTMTSADCARSNTPTASSPTTSTPSTASPR